MPNRSGPSNLRSLAVDPPIVQDASFRQNAIDRAYVDDQIRALQQAMVDGGGLSGVHGAWLTIDGASAAVNAGDCVVSYGTNPGTVTRGTGSALIGAQLAYVVLRAASPGAKVFVAVGGVIPSSITGLGASAGFVRVNSTSGRCEVVASIGSGDVPLGKVSSSGDLTVMGGPPGPDNQIKGKTVSAALASVGQGYAYDGTNISPAFQKPAITVSARDYSSGLKPNDPTFDNATAINAALTAVASMVTSLTPTGTGGAVMLDGGNYYHRTPIAMTTPGIALIGGCRNGSAGASLTTQLIWNGTTAKRGTAATVSSVDGSQYATIGGLGGQVSSADVGKILWLHNPATAANIGGWRIASIVDSSTVTVSYRNADPTDIPPVAGDTGITWAIPEQDALHVYSREQCVAHISFAVAATDYTSASPCYVRAAISNTSGGGALCTQNHFTQVRCSTEGLTNAVMIFGVIHGDSTSTPMQGNGPSNCDEMLWDRCYFAPSYCGFWNGNGSGQSKNHLFVKCTFDAAQVQSQYPAKNPYFIGCLFLSGNAKFDGCTANACPSAYRSAIVDYLVFEDCEEENCLQLYYGPQVGSWSSTVTFRGGRYHGGAATTARPYITCGGNGSIVLDNVQWDASRNTGFRIATGNSSGKGTSVVARSARFPYESPFTYLYNQSGAWWMETLQDCVYVDNSGSSIAMPNRLNAPGSTHTFQGAGFNFVANGQVSQQGSNVTLANGANLDIAHNGYGLLRVTGPTAAFSMSGFVAPQSDWAQLTVWVTVNQACTVKNEDASETTAARRITTRTGADVVVSGQAGGVFISFLYDPNTSRWIYTGWS